jgi:hypothetical protein
LPISYNDNSTAKTVVSHCKNNARRSGLYNIFLNIMWYDLVEPVLGRPNPVVASALSTTPQFMQVLLLTLPLNAL